MVALLYKILEISCENPICQGRENIPLQKEQPCKWINFHI